MKRILIVLFCFVYFPILSQRSNQEYIEFAGASDSETAFIDIDGDNDLDILISGRVVANICEVKLYVNNGDDSFTLVPNTPFSDYCAFRGIEVADFDGDKDMDVLLISGGSTKLYFNDGNGVFEEALNTSFIGAPLGRAIVFDADGDTDVDIFIGTYTAGVKMYLNNGEGVFTDVGNPLNVTLFGAMSIAYSDIDNDEDDDLLIASNYIEGNYFFSETKLYTNDGNGNFTQVENGNFTGVAYSDLAFSDVDNDGDSDILLSGRGRGPFPNLGSFYVTELHLNNGAGVFTLDSNTSFILGNECKVIFGDLDNNGFDDMLTVGFSSLYDSYTRVYNNFEGTFSLTNRFLPNVRYGDINLADVNNDGFLDVLISGQAQNSQGGRLSRLYLSDNSSLLDISENELKDKIEIFQDIPNQELEIRINYSFNSMKINLYDALGQLVYNNLISNINFLKIDMSSYSKGLYILNIINKNGNKEVFKILNN